MSENPAVPAAGPSFRDRIVRSGYEAPDQLLANPWNFRRHTSAQFTVIEGSLNELGWIRRVLVNLTTQHVIDGHARIEYAIRKGLTSIPVDYVELTEAEEKIALAVLDPSSEMAYRDDEAVEQLLRSISTEDAGIRALMTQMAIDSRIDMGNASVAAAAATPEPANPESQVAPITKAGDIIELGIHRLICGDSRDADVVARLMNGRKINLAFTSPPYADQREYDTATEFRPIHPNEYVEWFRDVSANVKSNLAPDGSWFVNIKPSADGLDTSLYVMDLVIAHVREWGWHFATEFCWERNGVPKGVTQRFKNQFEPIYQFALDRWKMRPEAVRHESENVPRAGGKGSGETSWGRKQGGKGSNNPDSVSGSFGGAKKRAHGTSEYMAGVQGENHQPGEFIGPGLAFPGNRLPTFISSHEATGHTAAFPIGLPQFFIKAYTDIGDTVYDPFAGSGSTLMASEIEGRPSFNVEISPAYCDVIVSRWEKATGLSPRRPTRPS